MTKDQLPRIPPKHLKDGCYARADALEAHLNAARAEIERLRSALDYIAGLGPDCDLEARAHAIETLEGSAPEPECAHEWQTLSSPDGTWQTCTKCHLQTALKSATEPSDAQDAARFRALYEDAGAEVPIFSVYEAATRVFELRGAIDRRLRAASKS